MGIALVTGGAGFVGSHLVDHLLDQDLDVRVLDNLTTGSLRNLQSAAEHHATAGSDGLQRRQRRLELMIGDVRDERLVRKAMHHVDVVFHLAAVAAGHASPTNASEVHAVNVHGTLNVLQAATAEGVRRVVFASCQSVYGLAPGEPIVEDTPAAPVTVAGASKLAAETYCRAYHAARHVEAVCLRYFGVYGPRQSLSGGLIPGLIETLRRRRRPVVPGDARTGHDLLYVDDAVAATLAAASIAGAAGHAINVGSGHLASGAEIVELLNHLLRTDAVLRVKRPANGNNVRAGIGLAQRALGWSPRVSLVAGLAKTVRFFEEAERPEEGLLAEVGSGEERPDF